MAALSGAEIRLVSVMPGFGMPIVAAYISDEVRKEAGDNFKASLEKFIQDNCDESVIKTVDIAFNSRGHIVVCGVGKAGLIGQKISATLASLGFPSFFMHPTEALHGDLGMVHKNDVFIVLSNSGSLRFEQLLEPVFFLPRSNAGKISQVCVALLLPEFLERY